MKNLVAVIVNLVLFAFVLLASFGGTGIVALIWGPDAVKIIFVPDRWHPAFWVFLLVMIASALISLVGMLAIMLPVWGWAGQRIRSFEDPALKLFRMYAVSVAKLCNLSLRED